MTNRNGIQTIGGRHSLFLVNCKQVSRLQYSPLLLSESIVLSKKEFKTWINKVLTSIYLPPVDLSPFRLKYLVEGTMPNWQGKATG